jgi:hypothetical protein
MAKKPRSLHKRATSAGRKPDPTATLTDAHRQDLRAGRALVSLLFAQLKEAAENPDAVSSHVRILGDLVTVMRNLVPLERQAFDLDPESNDGDATGLADRLQKARSRLDGKT